MSSRLSQKNRKKQYNEKINNDDFIKNLTNINEFDYNKFINIINTLDCDNFNKIINFFPNLINYIEDKCTKLDNEIYCIMNELRNKGMSAYGSEIIGSSPIKPKKLYIEKLKRKPERAKVEMINNYVEWIKYKSIIDHQKHIIDYIFSFIEQGGMYSNLSLGESEKLLTFLILSHNSS